MELALETASNAKKVFSQEADSWKYIRKENVFNRQISAIEETLSKFGLLKNEIKVYLHLARVGDKKAGEIAEAISLHRTETYRILRDLEKKGIVFSVFEKPIKFTAIPLDKAIDILVNAQRMKINLLEKEKESLVELWQSMPQMKTENKRKELFQMLEGEQQVLLKATELLENAQKKFQIFAADDYLSQLHYSDFTDALKEHQNKIDIDVLTGDSPKSVFFLKQLLIDHLSCQSVDANNLPCFMISDEKEVLIAFHESDHSEENPEKKKYRTIAIWTNYSAFICTFEMLFSKLAVS
jgi:sugar-specific transcriptional regulator TrmB